MQIEAVHLGEIVVLSSQAISDDRGFFLEVFRADEFARAGLPSQFVQDNHSGSRKGVIRGLHFQWDPPMGKLMRVSRGAAFLVAVDVRKDSPTLGKWFGLEVAAESRKQVWAPYGFARGFCALTDGCEVQYKCTGVYNPKGESGILYCDPEIGISWPIQHAIVSEKDRNAQSLKKWLASPLSSNVVCSAAEPAG